MKHSLILTVLPTMTKENLALLTNPEVIAVNQQGSNQHRVQAGDRFSLWISDAPDGKSRYVMLINRSGEARSYEILNEWIGFSVFDRLKVRDLWQRKDIEDTKSAAIVTQVIPSHGCVMYKATPKEN